MSTYSSVPYFYAYHIFLSLGDLRYKRFGITSEPEVRSKLLEGNSFGPQILTSLNAPIGKSWAFAVLVSDGISSELSDDEIVDLARGSRDPKTAADRILAFSEELGGQDNATAIVVPLAGWGRIEGPDKTKELREYRRKQAGVTLFRPYM